MLNSKLLLSFVFVSIFSVSCASKHTMMKGSVAMKLEESKGVACLFGEEPSVGAKLTLFNNDCTGTKGKEGGVSCRMVKSGSATITRMINDHYAEFETDGGVSFVEGSIIEISK